MDPRKVCQKQTKTYTCKNLEGLDKFYENGSNNFAR